MKCKCSGFLTFWRWALSMTGGASEPTVTAQGQNLVLRPLMTDSTNRWFGWVKSSSWNWSTQIGVVIWKRWGWVLTTFRFLTFSSSFTGDPGTGRITSVIKAVVVLWESSSGYMYSLTNCGWCSHHTLGHKRLLFVRGIALACDMTCVGALGAYMQVIAAGHCIQAPVLIPSSTSSTSSTFWAFLVFVFGFWRFVWWLAGSESRWVTDPLDLQVCKLRKTWELEVLLQGHSDLNCPIVVDDPAMELGWQQHEVSLDVFSVGL